MKQEKTCEVCGNLFYCLPNRPRVTCSHECAAQRRKKIRAKNHKLCVVCGELFYCPLSNVKKVTCSPECSIQHRKNNVKAGIFAEFSQRACEVRKDLPHLGRTEENIHAKSWVIQAPNGQVYECRNLKHWLREHADLLDATPERAFEGIRHIKYSKIHKPKNAGYQWKGWRLLSWGD